VPSAFCGIVGFKGTWGAVGTEGMWPMGRTLDHAGPMAATPADAALLQAVLAGDGTGELAPPPAGTRVGTSPGFMAVEPAVERAVADAVAALEGAGCTAVESRLEDAAGLVTTFVTIRDAETLHAHRAAGLFPDRRGEYGPLTAERLEAAVGVGLGDYLEASAARARAAEAFDRVFESADVLVLPVSAGSPPLIDGGAPDERAWAMVHPLTVPFNLLGVPACVVRAGFDDEGLPVGVQVVGRHGGDRTVLEVAQALFDATAAVQAKRPDRRPRAAASSRASGT
jgi:aspartyl-tRNA(Asn)/glutamyl-tRNA(Gln) amidotransferase subunit A